MVKLRVSLSSPLYLFASASFYNFQHFTTNNFLFVSFFSFLSADVPISINYFSTDEPNIQNTPRKGITSSSRRGKSGEIDDTGAVSTISYSIALLRSKVSKEELKKKRSVEGGETMIKKGVSEGSNMFRNDIKTTSSGVNVMKKTSMATEVAQSSSFVNPCDIKKKKGGLGLKRMFGLKK